MADLWTHPLAVAALVLLGAWQAVLWLVPSARRARAARDLARAEAMDAYRRVFAAELKLRRSELGLEKEGSNA